MHVLIFNGSFFFASCCQLALFYSEHQGCCDLSMGCVTLYMLIFCLPVKIQTQASCALANIFA